MAHNGYALEQLPVPGNLGELGDAVEIREVPYGVVRRAMSSDRASETLLLECLIVDGVHLTLDELDALPGRYTGALLQAQESIFHAHSLAVAGEIAKPAAAAPEADEGNA
jgi:hypothetical protein